MIKNWKFSDIPLEAVFKYEYLERQCREYECNEKPLISIRISDEDIAHEASLAETSASSHNDYLESLAFYRRFATEALNYNAMLMHGSTISYKGKAYIYTAPSGTGKSTHSRLCKKVYGDAVDYINDDKPLLRLVDGIWRAYGTPWDGKHHLSRNCSAPIGGICFLTRGTENSINSVSFSEQLCDLLAQIYRPDEANMLCKALDLLDSMSDIPMWKMSCTISDEAALMSLSSMSKP